MEREKAIGVGLDQGIIQDHSVGIRDLEFQGWRKKKSILGFAGRANPAGVGSVGCFMLMRDVGWEEK